jgi:hypothetical protein
VEEGSVFGFRISVVFANFRERFVDDRVTEFSSGFFSLCKGGKCL